MSSSNESSLNESSPAPDLSVADTLIVLRRLRQEIAISGRVIASHLALLNRVTVDVGPDRVEKARLDDLVGDDPAFRLGDALEEREREVARGHRAVLAGVAPAVRLQRWMEGRDWPFLEEGTLHVLGISPYGVSDPCHAIIRAAKLLPVVLGDEQADRAPPQPVPDLAAAVAALSGTEQRLLVAAARNEVEQRLMALRDLGTSFHYLLGAKTLLPEWMKADLQQPGLFAAPLPDRYGPEDFAGLPTMPLLSRKFLAPFLGADTALQVVQAAAGILAATALTGMPPVLTFFSSHTSNRVELDAAALMRWNRAMDAWVDNASAPAP